MDWVLLMVSLYAAHAVFMAYDKHIVYNNIFALPCVCFPVVFPPCDGSRMAERVKQGSGSEVQAKWRLFCSTRVDVVANANANASFEKFLMVFANCLLLWVLPLSRLWEEQLKVFWCISSCFARTVCIVCGKTQFSESLKYLFQLIIDGFLSSLAHLSIHLYCCFVHEEVWGSG